MPEVRPAAVAAAFYPGDPDELSRMIDTYLEEAKPIVEKVKLGGELKGIVAPHAGYIYSGPIAATGFSLIKRLDQKKDWNVLLMGPSHYMPIYGAAPTPFPKWETPLGEVPAEDIRKVLEKKSEQIVDAPAAHLHEHSLEVEVPFLQKTLKKFTLYPLVLGDIDPEKLAEDLKDFCAKEDTIVVVSSDLSHYFPYKEARALDAKANEAIPALDTKKTEEEVEACGRNGILTAMHIAKMLDWKGVFVDYRNSGDTAGDKSQVVGYGCYAFVKP